MRILQINKFFHIKGGSETYLFSLINCLKDKGVTVAEFAMNDPGNQYSEYSKHFVSNINYQTKSLPEQIKYTGKIFYSVEAKRKIKKLLNEFNPDLAHLHIFQHQLSPSILTELKKRGIPVVYTAHDLKSICPNYKMLSNGRICEDCFKHRYYKCLLNKCVKNSYLKSSISTLEMYFHFLLKFYKSIDLIITPSDFYRKKLVEFRFPEKKVIHIPNFINEKKFQHSYNHKNYFIYLGRLSEEKGISTLIEAMKNVTRSQLIIIGSGPMEKRIRYRIKALGLNNIELVGFQSGESLRNYISSAMFSIMPSEWYENGPISLLESFGYGKPVIGSDIGGIPEHIEHGKDGLIFQPKNPNDLAKSINLLLDDPNRLSAMSKAAKKKAVRLYNKERHLSAVIEVYRQLIETNRFQGFQ